MNIDDIYKLIEKSNLTLIGYTYKVERIKDIFISKLNPHCIDYPISIQSHLRDIKIDEILTNRDHIFSRYVVFDLNNVPISSLFDKPKLIREISEKMRSESIKNGYRCIMTSPMHHQSSDERNLNFIGGISSLYTCDLAIRFNTDDIEIIKSRYTDSGIRISYDELENFSYI